MTLMSFFTDNLNESYEMKHYFETSLIDPAWLGIFAAYDLFMIKY